MTDADRALYLASLIDSNRGSSLTASDADADGSALSALLDFDLDLTSAARADNAAVAAADAVMDTADATSIAVLPSIDLAFDGASSATTDGPSAAAVFATLISALTLNASTDASASKAGKIKRRKKVMVAAADKDAAYLAKRAKNTDSARRTRMRDKMRSDLAKAAAAAAGLDAALV